MRRGGSRLSEQFCTAWYKANRKYNVKTTERAWNSKVKHPRCPHWNGAASPLLAQGGCATFPYKTSSGLIQKNTTPKTKAVPGKQRAGPFTEGRREVTEQSSRLTRQECSCTSVTLTPAKNPTWLKKQHPFQLRYSKYCFPSAPVKERSLRKVPLLRQSN